MEEQQPERQSPTERLRTTLIAITPFNETESNDPRNSYRKDMLYAIDAIERGHNVELNMLLVIRNHLSAKASFNELPLSWKLYQTESNAKILMHEKFAEIQDRYGQGELDPAKSFEAENQYQYFPQMWDREDAVETLGVYLEEKIKARQQSEIVLEQTLELLGANDTESKAKASLQSAKTIRTIDELKAIYMIAIPHFKDAPELWKEYFGFDDQLLNHIATYAKINEIGIIYASAHDRNNMPQCNDYFAYVGLQILDPNQNVLTFQEQIAKTGRHEGWHDRINEWSALKLAVGTNNPFYEGYAGQRGADERWKENIKLKISWDQLLTHPVSDELDSLSDNQKASYTRNANNFAGSTYYEAITQILAEKGTHNIDTNNLYAEVNRGIAVVSTIMEELTQQLSEASTGRLIYDILSDYVQKNSNMSEDTHPTKKQMATAFMTELVRYMQDERMAVAVQGSHIRGDSNLFKRAILSVTMRGLITELGLTEAEVKAKYNELSEIAD